MRKAILPKVLAAMFVIFGLNSTAKAHFQIIIPSDDMVMASEDPNLNIELLFGHPFIGDYLPMEKPTYFGVLIREEKFDLSNTLKPVKIDKSVKGYTTEYPIKRPGDYIFYVVPAPYFEPAEKTFIVHFAKVIVHAFGMEKGWDEEVGLKTEILPLTRPYGLWKGNVFQGIVKAFGETVPFAEVEVEYYANGKIKPPADPFITQVIKSDINGVFAYAFPKAGWWGFSALGRDKKLLKHRDGREYPVEIGAVIWVKVHDMP